MAKGMGGGIDFPPGSKKSVASITQEGAEDAGGAGNSPEASQERERISALINTFTNDWARAESIFAAFLDRKIKHSELDAYLDRCAEQIDSIDTELKRSGNPLPERSALAALVKDSRKAYARYAKNGKSMLGQQLREQDSLFGDLADANAGIASLNRSLQGVGSALPIEKALEMATRGGIVAEEDTQNERPSDIARRAGVEQETTVIPAPDATGTSGGTRRGTSAGAKGELIRQRGKKKSVTSETVPTAIETDQSGAGEPSAEPAPEGLGDSPDVAVETGSVSSPAKTKRGRVPHKPGSSAVDGFQLSNDGPPSGEPGMDATRAEIVAALNTVTKEALTTEAVAYKDTPELAKARLERQVRKSELREVYVERDKELAGVVEGRKQEYFKALEAFQLKRSMIDAVPERLGLKKAEQNQGDEALKSLKRQWVQARAEQARFRLEAAQLQREERGTEERKSRDTEKVLERFQRRYIVKEAAIKAAEEEATVRASALGARSGNFVEASAKWLKEHPKAMLIASSLGVGFGSAATGIALTAGTLATGGIAMVPVLVAASAGLTMRWMAEDKRVKAEDLERAGGPATEVARLRAAQANLQERSAFTTFSGIGGFLTGLVTSKAQKEARARKQAAILRKDTQGNIGGNTMSIGDLRSEDALQVLTKDLDRAYASIKQMDSIKTTLSTTVGAGIGIGAGALYGEVAHYAADNGADVLQAGTDKVGDVFDSGVDKAKDVFGGKDAPAPAAEPAGALKVEVDKGAPTTGAQTDAAPAEKTVAGADTKAVDASKVDAAPVAAAKVEAAPAAPDGLMAEAVVKPGQGFGEMIVALRGQIPDDVENPSAALKHVLETDANALTRELQVARDGQSLVVHPGDKFIVDNDQNIWYQTAGGKPQLAFENVPVSAEHPLGYDAHDIKGEMRADVIPQAKALGQTVGGAATETPVTTATTEAPQPITVEQSVVGVTVEKNVELQPGLSVPADLNTTPPEEVAAPKAPATEPAPTEAPKAPTEAPRAPAPAPEQAPAAEVVGGAMHPFAQPDAGPLMNPNGVDLNKPQILVNENRYWAMGTSTEDSFNRAAMLSKELAMAPGASSDSSLTNVYFVAKQVNELGVPFFAVKMVYTTPGSDPQIAGPEAGVKIPDLPDASKFTLPTRR